MQIGMIGLGRMGSNMVRRLMRAGHSLVVFDRSSDAVHLSPQKALIGATSLADLVAGSPRHAWSVRWFRSAAVDALSTSWFLSSDRTTP